MPAWLYHVQLPRANFQPRLRALAPDNPSSAAALDLCALVHVLFFFQAEDGIRDTSVTGVQTCALPICVHGVHLGQIEERGPGPNVDIRAHTALSIDPRAGPRGGGELDPEVVRRLLPGGAEIGRASCRERR